MSLIHENIMWGPVTKLFGVNKNYLDELIATDFGHFRNTAAWELITRDEERSSVSTKAHRFNLHIRNESETL